MRLDISRRKFLGNASLAAGALGVASFGVSPQESGKTIKSSGQVVVGTVSVAEVSAPDTVGIIRKVLAIMEEMIPYKPDIICLPEVFAFTHIANNYQLKDVAEKVPGPVVTPFLQFAGKHKCYVICPTYSLLDGDIYISAVLIDRNGKVAGEYQKMRPAESELEMGIKPGRKDPPVFQTDFGKIGIQICFDIKYDDGWNYLKEKGAQIIFWPSAYAAGQEISSRAWRHQLYIVTSTHKDTSKICDITGETIAQTGRWQPGWVCAPVNLEKAFIHAWPAATKFPEIQKKYGTRIGLSTYTEEEWSIIESLDPDLKIADVLKEFDLKTMHDFVKDLSVVHEKRRKKT